MCDAGPRSSSLWDRGVKIGKAPRITQTPRSALDQEYHTDNGNKMSLATGIARSPRRYAVLHSRQPRMATVSSFAMNCPETRASSSAG